MGFECVYEESHSASNVIINKEHVKFRSCISVCMRVLTDCSHFVNMKSRLQALEQLVMRHDERLGNGASNSTDSSVPDQDLGIDKSKVSDDGAVFVIVQDHRSEDKEDTGDELDGMAISLVDERDPGYFGKTTARAPSIITREMLSKRTTNINWDTLYPAQDLRQTFR